MYICMYVYIYIYIYIYIRTREYSKRAAASSVRASVIRDTPPEKKAL